MRTLISCLLIGIAAVGQQSTSDLEARVRELESRASRADALAARVFDLERQLAGHEARAAGEALEEAINVLLATQDDAVVAHARKAQSLTIGGQLRLRAEYRLVSRYQAANPSTTDEDMVIQRTRINFDARVHEHIRIFAEIQDSRLWGEEMSVTTDLMGVDLHQGYIDFEQALGTPFTVRSGRFELKLWNQRLISPLDWHPVGRAWDGVLVFGKPSEDWLLHAGYHLIAEGGAIDSDQDTDLYWTAATYTGAENHELGAAFFWLHADTPPAADPALR
ncbi:MAG: hypothetical protein CMJ83_10070, partial [Planctomycetes bacterium]|nr:hypothetical protein [Planctomycetota bacterium]